MQNCAYLGCSGKYSVFAFNEYVIRFRTSSHLQKYSEIKHWAWCLPLATAYYDTAGELEEYIDLIPMLRNLFIEPEVFLSPIKEVKLQNA